MKPWTKLTNGLAGLLLLSFFVLLPWADAQMESVAKAPAAGQSAPADRGSDLETGTMELSSLNQRLIDDVRDHKAYIFKLGGSVKILKKGNGEWTPAQKGMLIEEGDQLLTGSDGFIHINYDRHFLNIAKIDANTKAEFRTIEPTDLYLEDGSVFSALDGLGTGNSYQVSTPTAVAAVRGTHFFVNFDAASQQIEVATLPVPEDDHLSKVELTDLTEAGGEGASVIIAEGKEIILNPGEFLSDAMLHEVKPETLEEAKAVFADISVSVEGFESLRQEGKELFENHLELSQGNEIPNFEDDGDQNKVGNKPNDGGSSGPDALNFDGPANPNMHREGDVDFMVDRALDNQTINTPMMMGESLIPDALPERRVFDDSGVSNLKPEGERFDFDPTVVQPHPEQYLDSDLTHNPDLGRKDEERNAPLFPQLPKPEEDQHQIFCQGHPNAPGC